MAAAMITVIWLPWTAEARGTSAGALIGTAATATYTANGATVSVTSNTASVRVQEVLDVVVEPASGERPAVLPGDTARTLAFRIMNIGNGAERFRFAMRTDVGGGNFDPACTQLFLDDGSGAYETASDVPYVTGTNDPELRPDESITVFVVCTVPDAVKNDDIGNVVLDARAMTLDRQPAHGDGGPGSIFIDPMGDGIDAVVGSTAAKASAAAGMIVVASMPSLIKAQRVTDPSGGTSPVAGAIVTYTISADIRAGSVMDAVVADSIPAGTTYEPGSLAISDGNGAFAPLTDAADDDAGRSDGQRVEFNLGQIIAGVPARSVRFQVRINKQ